MNTPRITAVDLPELAQFGKGTTVYQCADCGAYSLETPLDIKHYPNCKPGDSEKWEKFYADEL
jgi:hypothetical protein